MVRQNIAGLLPRSKHTVFTLLRDTYRYFPREESQRRDQRFPLPSASYKRTANFQNQTRAHRLGLGFHILNTLEIGVVERHVVSARFIVLVYPVRFVRSLRFVRSVRFIRRVRRQVAILRLAVWEISERMQVTVLAICLGIRQKCDFISQ